MNKSNKSDIQLENGKRYLITHSRKGTFTVEVKSQKDEAVYCVIIKGKTKTLCGYITKRPGDEIIIHRSFIVSAEETNA